MKVILGHKFDMSDDVDINYHIGLQIYRNHTLHTIVITKLIT